MRPQKVAEVPVLVELCFADIVRRQRPTELARPDALAADAAGFLGSSEALVGVRLLLAHHKAQRRQPARRDHARRDVGLQLLQRHECELEAELRAAAEAAEAQKESEAVAVARLEAAAAEQPRAQQLLGGRPGRVVPQVSTFPCLFGRGQVTMAT